MIQAKKPLDFFNEGYLGNTLLMPLLLNINESSDTSITFNVNHAIPTTEKIDSLSSISALYLYTNPPPTGSGTPAPKVAETVLRAYSYNRNKETNKEITIDRFIIENMAWDNKEPYPYDEITGNFSPYDSYRMFKAFLVKNSEAIRSTCNKVMEKLLSTNSDILTKGRQTWDCIYKQSVTSAIAYNRMAKLFRDHLGIRATNCFEWIECAMRMLTIPVLKIPEKEERWDKTRRFSKTESKYVEVYKKRVIMRIKEYKGEEVKIKMLNMYREFCPYIKYEERGKLKKRAIVSANIVMRMFLLITEEFHLELGKLIPGSTISVGGEEKKMKIVTNLSSLTINSEKAIYLQATEDATKFNECLSPQCFALMHDILFDENIRTHCGLEQPTELETLFKTIAVTGNFLISIKRVHLGQCMIFESESTFNRPKWAPELKERMNKRTREWYEQIIPLMEEGEFIRSSPGMLMGMYNAASTTLGLTAVGYGIDSENAGMVTLRSSDDSLTRFVASEPNIMFATIEQASRALKMIGINRSPNKTFIFSKTYGEYTSWYIDGKFTSQYGVETSTLRPGGKNPSDDLYAISKGAAVSQTRLEMNPIGAEMKLIIGIDNVRRLYRIDYQPGKRQSIRGSVQLIEDGGISLWNSMNCHLEQIAMKSRIADNEAEKEYLLRIQNPENPFSAPPEDSIRYDKELNAIIATAIQTPRNIFSYMRRSNRSNIGKTDRKVEEEKDNTEALDILQSADPTLFFKTPSTSVSMADHLISILDAVGGDLELSENEKTKLKKAISKLREDQGEADLDIEEVPDDF